MWTKERTLYNKFYYSIYVLRRYSVIMLFKDDNVRDFKSHCGKMLEKLFQIPMH